MKTLRILVLATLLIPSMAHAAWYSPATWFKKEASTTTEVPAAIVPEVKEVRVELPVVKEVKVDNPQLLAAIEVLKAENKTLKAQVESLTAMIKRLEAIPASPTVYVETLTAGCQAIKDEYDRTLAARDDAKRSHQEKMDAFVASIKKANNATKLTLAELQSAIDKASIPFVGPLSLIEGRFTTLCPGKSLI